MNKLQKVQKFLDTIIPFFVTLGIVNAAYSLHAGLYDNFLIAIGSVVVMVLAPRLVKDDKNNKGR